MHLLFFLLLRALDFFNPSPPIIVARDTTYITAPLGRDGLPDYEKYWLQTVRKGVTPENNACALLWQAVWPEKFDPADSELMRSELGLKQLPPAKDALQNVYGEANEERIRAWLQAQGLSHDDASVDKIFDLADGHPWTAQQFPPLADWVRENEGLLDLVVKASHRPRYYAPSPCCSINTAARWSPCCSREVWVRATQPARCVPGLRCVLARIA